MKPMDGNAAGHGRDRSTARRFRQVALATLVAAAALFGQAPEAVALTAQEQFLATLGKVAPFAPAKAKRLCRCTAASDTLVDVGVGELRTIFVAQNGIEDYGVVCAVPTFNASSGALESTRPCTNNEFEILPK